MKKKGFTLVELLAVIVVLAVIALVATIVITKVVDKARKKADLVSAYNYMEAVERYSLICELEHKENCIKENTKYYLTEQSKYDSVTYNIIDKIISPVKAEYKVGDFYLNDVISIKGKAPSDGYIVIDSNNKVKEAKLSMTIYEVVYEEGKCEVAGKVNTSSTVKSLKITNTETSLKLGKTLQLNYEIKATEDVQVKWSSSDDNIATVDDKGLVTAVNEGEVTITVSADKKSSNIKLIVEKSVVCKHKSGTELTVGSVYTCDPGDGEERDFYLFSKSGDNILFLMSSNLPGTTTWDNRRTHLNNQTSNWTDVTVSIPTRAQICAVVGQPTNQSVTALSSKSWLYNGLSGSGGSCGYWADDKASGNTYIVRNPYLTTPPYIYQYVRPLITVSKDLVG